MYKSRTSHGNMVKDKKKKKRERKEAAIYIKAKGTKSIFTLKIYSMEHQWRTTLYPMHLLNVLWIKPVTVCLVCTIQKNFIGSYIQIIE